MRKIMILAVALVVLLSGCATNKKANLSLEKPVKNTSEKSKVVGAEGVTQPSWVYAPVDDDKFYYGVGYAKLSNRLNSAKAAKMDASAALAERLKQEINRIQKLYLNDSGVASVGSDSYSFDSNTDQTVSATLYGVNQVDQWVAADETVYVLVSIPRENLKYALETQLDADTNKKVAAATSEEAKKAAAEANAKRKTFVEENVK